MSQKPIVFFIMPFQEDFQALLEKMRTDFGSEFEFVNAGDLDSQQSILKDIVQGIHTASIVIADLTGLNPNVFYELGLAHAMNKKVIIITQNINDIPFDIKCYRAIEYGIAFYKIPRLFDELQRLLRGAMDGSITFGNPVSDYIPNPDLPQNEPTASPPSQNELTPPTPTHSDVQYMGYVDYIAGIEENSQQMREEIEDMSGGMREMGASVNQATNEINRVKAENGSVDATFVRNTCRRLSGPVDAYAQRMKNHVQNIATYWSAVENYYLELLDTPFVHTPENAKNLSQNINSLVSMQSAMVDSDHSIDTFINALRGSLGVERRLTRAITSLIAELEAYLTMTNTIYSSIDRIIAKSNMVISSI